MQRANIDRGDRAREADFATYLDGGLLFIAAVAVGEDHAIARTIAEILAQTPGVTLGSATLESNIVLVRLADRIIAAR